MLSWKEIRPIFFALLRWWWVIVGCMVLAGATAFLLSTRELKYYTTHATMKIGTPFDAPLPDRSQIEITEALMSYYAEIATRPVVLDKVVEKLGLSFNGDVIRLGMMRIQPVPQASLLEIYITDSNPDRGAAIANSIGEELVLISPSSPEKVAAEQQAITRQIEETDKLMQDLERRLTDLEAKYQQATSASEQRELQAQIAESEMSLAREKEQFNNLLLLKNNTVANSLSFFERAEASVTPLPSRRLTTVAIASVIGMLFSMLVIFALEKLDLRWKGTRDVETRLQMRSLGEVPLGPPLIQSSGEFALAREVAIREVHTNILLQAPEGRIRSLLVSSPIPTEDRATLSIDLALIFARSGYRVLLIDADLEQRVLTKFMLNRAIITANPIPNTVGELAKHLKSTKIQNVLLLPGRIDNGGGMHALIPSMHWPELIQKLLDIFHVIIFDGPSALGSADAALLTPHVDGAVLALDPAINSRKQSEESRKRLLHRKGAQLLGAVTFTSMNPERLLKKLPGYTTLALPAPATVPESGLQAESEPTISPTTTTGTHTIITPPQTSVDDQDEPVIISTVEDSDPIPVNGEQSDESVDAVAAATHGRRRRTPATSNRRGKRVKK
jgi:capsular polysaccharide biosynthesis protein/Mrp family chromosome partitioning ATPase